MQLPFSIDEIFSINDENQFQDFSLKLFNFQVKHNTVYAEFINHLGKKPSEISSLLEIPFLPISVFKSHEVKTGHFIPQTTFTSSATTGNTPSKHLVKDLSIYSNSFEKGFEIFYGKIKGKPLLALLPSYLEREGSSLILMAQELIKNSERKESGFFLNDFDRLVSVLKTLEQKNEPYVLLGVSFALLELAEKYNLRLSNATIMETGGMKGRRKEVTRFQLHQEIAKGLGTTNIHSEYGMTELLSQAYALKKGQFETPPWMKVLIRDTTDPLQNLKEGRGGINVIDLVNIYSCAFIATQDLGRLQPNGTFEVLGRFDDAEVRGCNLMFT